MVTARDFTIKVEQCIDSDDFVWSILDEYNGVRCDGYAATEPEALADAKKRRAEEIDYLNSPVHTDQQPVSPKGLAAGQKA